MAFNISTLSVSRNEIIKADKINFLIDYVRSLKNSIDSIKTDISSIKSNYMEIPSSNDIIEISSTKSVKLPSGGKWLVDVLYIVSEFPDMAENHIAGFYSGIKNGGSYINMLNTDANYTIVQGFALRLS